MKYIHKCLDQFTKRRVHAMAFVINKYLGQSVTYLFSQFADVIQNKQRNFIKKERLILYICSRGTLVVGARLYQGGS